MSQPAPVAEDQATRDDLLKDLDSTYVVEAAAGTGKTTVLVGRIVAVVAAGRARLSEIVSVTFTEKAAGEMKLRLRDALERRRQEEADPEVVHRLTEALEALEVARIGTIHGLCADFLREYPVQAGVDPMFEVASEGDAEAILHAAFSRSFEGLLRQPPEGVRRILRRRIRGGPDARTPRQQLLSAVRTLVDHRDFATPWRKDPFDRDAALDLVVEELRSLAALARHVHPARTAKKPPGLVELLEQLARFIADLDHREAVAPRDHDGLEAQLRTLVANRFRWTEGAWQVTYRGISEAEVLEARRAVHRSATALVEACDADLAACLHAELAPVVAAYEEEKARRGVLDFVDLLLRTRDLLVRDRSVREALQGKIHRLFIDEFQDTDPLQSELLLLLAADDPAQAEPFATRPVPGKLFVVGDPKQSIYRFRRADVLLYDRVKRHLEAHGARVVYLSTSFRSTPGIQAAINAAFSVAMGEGTGQQARHVPLTRWRAPFEQQPSVIALPAPGPFDGRRPRKADVEASLAQGVGAWIDWLVNHSGWTVEEEGRRVPVEPRHVCILFKRLRSYPDGDVPRPFARALEARKIPHVLVGGRSFHVREEVMALRTALLAIERPDDELSVFATLRGPFFAFPDDQLLVFKSEVGRFQPMRRLDDVPLSDASREVAEVLGLLRRLHLARNRQPAATTIHALLEATRAHASVAFWTAGQQALGNLLQLAGVVSGHEQRATSFRDVVEAVEDEAEEGEAPEAPIAEEGTEGVRMMTVHAAKGLEFPVVILAEPSARLVREEPSHWLDPDRRLWAHALAGCVPVELREHAATVLERDREEAVRLVYVAATRARDVLVVPVLSEDASWKQDTWLAVLDEAVWPTERSLHSPRPAPGCPPFGGDVILDRQAPVPSAVPLPGLHVARSERNGVVWWDASSLDLRRQGESGLDDSDALEQDEVEAPRARDAYRAWREAQLRTVEQGSVPSAVVVRASQAAPATEGTIEVVQVGHSPGRPSGRRFGELVHAVMAHVAPRGERAWVERVVAVHRRELLASDEEARAAVDAVVAALAHPVLAAARAAEACFTELPVMDVLEAGELLEGVVDLAFRDATGWTVVELKTDEDVQASADRYVAQTAAYVRAIRRATGQPARGLILAL